MKDAVMTAQEVAERCRVPVETLRYWRYAGRGPRWSKIGRHVRYRSTDVEAWLDEQFSTQNGPVTA